MKSRYTARPDLYLGTYRNLRIAVQTHCMRGTPKALHGLEILFATDIHARGGDECRTIAELLGAQRAQMILLGGDLADEREDALKLLGDMKGLYAPYGVYAVEGNNDIEAFGSTEAYGAALRKAGITLLADETAYIPINGAVLAVGGTKEYKFNVPDTSGLFSEPADLRICVSHYPVMPKLLPGREAALMLCGHTHGGQFNMLGITPYSIGFERLGPEAIPPVAVCGRVRIGQTDVLVSKGIGMSRIPLRVGVRPEIHRIVLC